MFQAQLAELRIVFIFLVFENCWLLSARMPCVCFACKEFIDAYPGVLTLGLACGY